MWNSRTFEFYLSLNWKLLNFEKMAIWSERSDSIWVTEWSDCELEIIYVITTHYMRLIKNINGTLQKCTTDVRCFCSYDYTGSDCSQRSNVTFIPITQSTPEPMPTSTTLLTEVPPMIDNVTEPTRGAKISVLTQKSPSSKWLVESAIPLISTFLSVHVRSE